MPSHRPPDHYTKLAKKKGFAARSVFKLEEIDRRHRLLKAGDRVLDLGCAPGSWSKYAYTKVTARGLVVGVDLAAPVIPLPAHCRWLTADLREVASQLIADYGPTFDCVLSDMAPKTSGMRDADHYRSLELARLALEVARQVLKPGGPLLIKVFQGPDFPSFRNEMAHLFQKVCLEKPDSSRSESREMFVLGLHFRAGAAR